MALKIGYTVVTNHQPEQLGVLVYIGNLIIIPMR